MAGVGGTAAADTAEQIEMSLYLPTFVNNKQDQEPLTVGNADATENAYAYDSDLIVAVLDSFTPDNVFFGGRDWMPPKSDWSRDGKTFYLVEAELVVRSTEGDRTIENIYFDINSSSRGWDFCGVYDYDGDGNFRGPDETLTTYGKESKKVNLVFRGDSHSVPGATYLEGIGDLELKAEFSRSYQNPFSGGPYSNEVGYSATALSNLNDLEDVLKDVETVYSRGKNAGKLTTAAEMVYRKESRLDIGKFLLYGGSDYDNVVDIGIPTKTQKGGISIVEASIDRIENSLLGELGRIDAGGPTIFLDR